MQNFYLIDYIKENLDIDQSILESIKYELDQHIYYYGNQFKYPKEKQEDFVGKISKERIKKKLGYYIALATYLFGPNLNNRKKNILSNAYFSINHELTNLNFNVYRPPWSIGRDLNVLANQKILREVEYFKGSFEKESFIDLISQEFIGKIHLFESTLKQYLIDRDIGAIFVPNDMGFFEIISINILRKINRPSFIYLHGLPGRYNNIDDNKSDYLIVWGEKIKDHYVRAGVDQGKILVSGHPYYKELHRKELRFKLDSPLIITKAMPGAPSDSKNDIRTMDRGNLILYLYMIQSVLSKFGVNRVRFRPHPSENSAWYLKFIDKDFFQVDNDNLLASLGKSTIVIGPTSTVFLEAIYNGLNYVCFDPCQNDISLSNSKLVPPFDGSDEKLPVAKNEEQLEQIIRDKTKVDARIFNDYIKTPFDLSFVKTMI